MDNVLAVILIVLAVAATLFSVAAYSIDQRAKHDHDEDEEK